MNHLAEPVHASSRNRRIASAFMLTAVFVLSSMLVALPGNSVALTPHASPYTAPTATPSALLTGAQLQQAPYQTSPGSGMPPITNGSVLAPVPTADPVSFTVGFGLQNESELTQILDEQQSAGSPMFQHWLTLSQENAMFGPNPVEVQNTINYFTSLGFRVGTEGPISVSFTGSAGAVNSAFKTTLLNVHVNSSIGIMNAQPLSLPSPIANGISTVNGLQTTDVAQPVSVFDSQLLNDISPAALAMTPNQLTSALDSPWLNASEAFNFTNAAFVWLHYFSSTAKAYKNWQVLTPGSLDKLYDVYPLLNAGINGNSTGHPITIALVMAGGINPSDVREYGQLVFNNPNAILNRLEPKPVDGSFTDNGTVTYTDGASQEMALDIDYSATMALAAKIMPVYGPCLCTNVLDDDYATIDGMTTVPNIVSNSWGGEEDTFGNLYGPNWQNTLTMHHYFELLDARGVTILASSADGGGFDTGTGMLSGAFPATDPYVLAVNGVRTAETDSSGSPYPATDSLGLWNFTVSNLVNWPLHVDSAQSILSQSFWYVPIANTTLYNAPPYASGGFGESYWFNQSWFQNGIGVPNLGRALGSGVAAEADFNETIYFDGKLNFGWGGTSFACPTTAGMFGLIDDYLLKNGKSAYLGDGNIPAFEVGNAWLNGNLSLDPYYDIVNNGTSYWGNFGVSKGYSWPPGQKYPMSPEGYTTYGNTTKGWDFPTGWGVIMANNFAQDLLHLEQLPANFSVINSTTNAYNVGAWDYMVLNQTYTIHMNASGAFAASAPTITVKFFPQSGQQPTSLQYPLAAVFNPTSGFNFQLDTSISPFNGPGLIIFEAGNASTRTAGFGYTWISWPVPPGTLTVTVVNPSQTSEVGGYAGFNPWPFGYDAPVSVSPSCCTAYPNTFTVQVTFNGQPVYNAQVDATIPNANVLAWQGSPLQGVTQGDGRPAHELTSNIVSQTFTNTSGFALVYTWNMVQPTAYYINATYGSALGGTTYTVTPGPNVGTTDDYGGNYSELNTVAFVLKQIHQSVNNVTENYWAPNSLYQSAYYDMVYAWQGEELPIHTNDYQGNAMPDLKVWWGDYDAGGENKFYEYVGSGGAVGVTNTSGTTGITNGSGDATVYIPQNQSLHFFVYPNGTSAAGFGFVSASIPGVVNRTFSYTEPCEPLLPNPKTTITCQYNDTFQRNYTSVPTIVFPDPVKAWTDTTSKVQRDFFGEGASIAAAVSINLPENDPFITGYGYNWPSGLEHVVSVNAYVDGVYAGSMTPNTPPDFQVWNSTVNLTGSYTPGNHTLDIVVDDSLGHVFTSRHTFIVGAVATPTLSQYTVLPYNLTWSLDIPAGEMNNHTYNQSLDIRYVTNGCGGSGSPCPTVVNETERIRDGVLNYYQLLNATLLNLDHFYGGATSLPAGQYQIILWLNANHSGSIATELSTYLVFNPVTSQLNGPLANETVPIGNVTLSYAYSGQYIQSANLSVYTSSNMVVPVFNVIAYVPGDGLRGGAATWVAVDQGPYVVVLAIGTPYGWDNISEKITVLETTGLVYVNQSSAAHPLGNMSPAETATILALVAGIIGLLIGLWVSPSFRRMPTGPGSKASAKPWEEGPGGGTTPKQAGRITCSVCKDEFSTEFALHEHQKIVHGIEE